MTTEATEQNTAATNGSNGDRRRVVMQVDDAGKSPSYANAFQVHAGAGEVVLDFGYRTAAGQVNVPTQDGGAEGADRVRFLVSGRVALTYPVAKQLAGMLNQILEQAERRAASQQ